jgi:acyl transferase domain-containing protein
MCAVFSSREQVDRAIATLPAEDQGKVVIAAVNGPKQTVMAGESDIVEQVAEVIEAKSVMLDAQHAMHSPLLAPILGKLREHLEDYEFRPPCIDMVSTVTGKAVKCLDPDYWIAHNEPLPVLFLDAMDTLLQDFGCTAFLEIGPQPVLMKMGQRCVRNVDRPLQWTATFDGNLPETQSVEKACSEVEGAAPAPALASVKS